MPKRILFLAAALVLFILTNNSLYAQSEWTAQTFTDADCTIAFPATVKTEKEVYTTKTTYTYSCRYQKHDLTLVCTVYNNNARSAAENPNKHILTAYLAKEGANTVSMNDNMNVGTNVAAEAFFKKADTKEDACSRVIVSEHIIYQMIVTAPEGKLNTTVCQTFFDSFTTK